MTEKPAERPAGDRSLHPVSQALFGWVSHRLAGPVIFWTLALGSLGLVLVDLVHHRHTQVDLERITGAYGLYGFLAFSFAVLAGWPLGKLLRRKENHYGDAGEPDGDETGRDRR